ncbi:hypothetical protein F2Q70_00019062 [Brassica cretica]|uniref:Uncharacterized protein n=1 Tax=Brassica cretica TaxID=69181 RepID=A0A8S9I335_BRACR|nr:hypothetical protein F2Q70_00019062 [Brassica cretica]
MDQDDSPASVLASVQPTGFCLWRSRVFLRWWTAGFCFWVAVASSVPLRRLLSPRHALLVLTATLTGVIPVSFDRRFYSSLLQSTLLPRLSIGTSSKKKDPLAREVMGRSHAQVSSAFNSVIDFVEIGGDSHGGHVSRPRQMLMRGDRVGRVLP